eukprot:3394858-Amphidinium_carterae.1
MPHVSTHCSSCHMVKGIADHSAPASRSGIRRFSEVSEATCTVCRFAQVPGKRCHRPKGGRMLATTRPELGSLIPLPSDAPRKTIEPRSTPLSGERTYTTSGAPHGGRSSQVTCNLRQGGNSK